MATSSGCCRSSRRPFSTGPVIRAPKTPCRARARKYRRSRRKRALPGSCRTFLPLRPLAGGEGWGEVGGRAAPEAREGHLTLPPPRGGPLPLPRDAAERGRTTGHLTSSAKRDMRILRHTERGKAALLEGPRKFG